VSEKAQVELESGRVKAPACAAMAEAMTRQPTPMPAKLPISRGLHSFPFPLNLSLLCPVPLNSSSHCPPYNPT
jgi:hypothetical protein